MKIDNMIEFFIREFGEDVLINGIERRLLIEDYQDKISENDDKIIKADFKINTGDIIHYQDQDWIIISDIDKNEKSHEAKIRKSDYSIKMYLDNMLHEFSTIIESNSTFSIADIDYISIADGNINVTLGANDITNSIKYEGRFIKMGSAWNIVGIDKTKKGLLILNCEKDLFNSQYDDRENEIADRWRYEISHSYAMTVEPTEMIMNEGDTQQIVVTVTDKVNNIISPVENPTLLYTSSDDTIATVDSTGLITAILEGMTTITVKFTSDDVESTQDINITITKEEITHTYSISGSDSITWTVTQTYKVVDESGNINTDRYFFSIDNSQLATLTTVDDQTCKIQGNSEQLKGDIVLQATSLSTYGVMEKKINIKGFW